MSVDILKSRLDNEAARARMRRHGIDLTSPPWVGALRRLGVLKGISVGDRSKSWDVLKTIEFLERNVPRDEPVLDMGAYASEVPCILQRMGYKNLSGIDLNPAVCRMPHADTIRYVIGDFLETPFEDASFRSITATSVIEHGFNGRKLLAEVARLLAPGGFFIASVDYWPDKLDTAGIQAFGMDWRIFSEKELKDFIALAGEFGMAPIGSMDFSAGQPAVKWMGKEYTFAWMALEKSRASA